MDDSLIAAPEVARLLSVSERTVRRIRQDGDLRCVRVRGSIRFRRSHVDEYIDSLPIVDVSAPPKRKRPHLRVLHGGFEERYPHLVRHRVISDTE